jgi:predicted ester cyclase
VGRHGRENHYIGRAADLLARVALDESGGTEMSAETNMIASRRLLEEPFNEGRLDVIDELVASNYVEHAPVPPGVTPDRAGLRQAYQVYLTAFPDARVRVEHQIADGDYVAQRWSAEGTHQGELLGIPPTGRRVTVTGLDIDRFEGGKVIEHWGLFDQLSMLQQIGAVPQPEASEGMPVA